MSHAMAFRSVSTRSSVRRRRRPAAAGPRRSRPPSPLGSTCCRRQGVVTHPYLGPLLRLRSRTGVAPGKPGELADGLSSSGVLGFEYIETDIRATADGVPVVFHDQSLNRVTDRVRRIRICLSARSRRRASAMPSGCIRCRRSWRSSRKCASTSTSGGQRRRSAARLTPSGGHHLDRVCIASFSWNRLRRVRARFGDAVCTSLAPQEVTALVGRTRLGRVSVASWFVLPSGPICSGAALGVRLADRHCGLHAPGPRTRMARSRVDGRRPGTDAWSAGSGSARDHHRPTQCVAAGDRRSDRRKCKPVCQAQPISAPTSIRTRHRRSAQPNNSGDQHHKQV